MPLNKVVCSGNIGNPWKSEVTPDNRRKLDSGKVKRMKIKGKK
tara:strand:- start:3883 stop:4011 length:129 start_codon:yes stop_codon:yes gene_type:complete